MAEPLYFTTTGLSKMQKQAEELEQKLQGLEAQMSEAAEVGGNQWHDNFSYEQLTQQIRAIDHRLKDVRHNLNQAVLVGKPDGSRVAIGTRVKIQFESDEEEWLIGGFGESDPDSGIIAYNTQLAKVLLGKTVGEKTTELIGDRNVEICIIEINVTSV